MLKAGEMVQNFSQEVYDLADRGAFHPIPIARKAWPARLDAMLAFRAHTAPHAVAAPKRNVAARLGNLAGGRTVWRPASPGSRDAANALKRR